MMHNHTADGCFNVSDLNRIEAATSEIAKALSGYGYSVSVSTKTWNMTDFPSQSQIDRIRHNIEALQMAFCFLPDWRKIEYSNTVDFAGANAMEWDLQCMSLWLDRMATAFVHSGENYAGEE